MLGNKERSAALLAVLKLDIYLLILLDIGLGVIGLNFGLHVVMQVLAYGQILRTHLLALFALLARRGGAVALLDIVQVIERLSHNIVLGTALLEPLPVVVKSEVIRDGNLLRTYINTISAVCTGDNGIAVDDFDYLR